MKTCAFVFCVAMVCAICGCHTRVWQTTPPAPGAALPGQIGPELAPENDPKFSAQEKTLITAARQYLEQQRGRSFDARYQVRRLDHSWAVAVVFVTTYQGGHALDSPGGRCTVILNEAAQVIRVEPN